MPRVSWMGLAAGGSVSKLSGLFELIPAGVPVTRLGNGRGKWHLPAVLFLESLLMISFSPAQLLRITNKSSHVPKAFFKLLLICSILVGLFVVLCL